MGLLQIKTASMQFSGVRALSEVSLTVEAGEVHALVGHNGSGKSTLVKVLAGEHSPERGTSVTVDGEALRFGSADEATSLGLRFVHQHLDLIYQLSVTENIAMGAGYGVKGLRRIRWSKEHARTRRDLQPWGTTWTRGPWSRT